MPKGTIKLQRIESIYEPDIHALSMRNINTFPVFACPDKYVSFIRRGIAPVLELRNDHESFSALIRALT